MHRIKLLCTVGMLAPIASMAQEIDSSKNNSTLDEYVISTNKFLENKKHVSQQIGIINNKEIGWSLPQTSATLLEQTGNIFVQKSQLGGGSPIIRGFEASRVLLVIDGVRMNNAIYRTGHLQNVITVDPNIQERVEILYGPSSTLYGSDALGGVIHFITKQPLFSNTKKTKVLANASTRYSTAYNSFIAHSDFNIGLKRFASLTSISYSTFGDIRKGANANPFYSDFGSRKEYVETINGMDSIVQNSDPNVQKFSGYHQWDLLQKFAFKQNDHIIHNINIQYSTSTDIPRYDRLTDIRNGKLRWAKWYYGPQDRLMAAYQFSAMNQKGWFNEIKAGINYQDIEESRHQRQRGSSDLESRIEKLKAWGYHIDLRKNARNHELSIGTEGQYNKVKSSAHYTDITNNETQPLDTRYPDGGSTMGYAAIYGQHIFKIIPGKLFLNDGIRFNYTTLKSEFKDKTFFPFPYSTAEQNNTVISGNLGLVYIAADNWRFTLNGSTGFRAPNVDDMSKVFESAGGEQLVVPNPDLKPEYIYNVDLGITFFEREKIKIEATAFYTWFRNAIISDRFTLNGQDSIEYDGAMTAIVANQNKAKAWMYGFNTSLTATLLPQLSFYTTLNLTHGRYFDASDKEVPLDHIPPVFGKTSVSYLSGKLMTEFFVLYNGWKFIKDYNPYGEDNQQYATAKGMPGWYTLNVRAGYNFIKHFSAEVAMENIMDKSYRTFASGIHAPGRNFVVSLKGNF